MGIEGYLVSPAVFKTVEGGDPALVSSILTCPRQNENAPDFCGYRGPGRFSWMRGGRGAGLPAGSSHLCSVSFWYIFISSATQALSVVVLMSNP